MTTRRARGEGSLYWSTTRQRWIAEVTIGFDASGKRITRKGAGETKTEAKKKLREYSVTRRTAYLSRLTATPWHALSKTG